MQRFWIWQAAAAAVLVAFPATPVLAQQQVLPRLADEVAAQFSAIGRFGSAGFREQQGCTATLIAPDLVVTAAHCVPPGAGPTRVFVAGWMRGDYIASRGAVTETRHPAYAPDGVHNPRNDVALVVLDQPIDDVAPIPLGSVPEGALDGTEAALIGYHYVTPHLLSGDFACPVTYLRVGLLSVGCPVVNGNSGSPLLAQTPDGAWNVVGVISSRSGAGAIAVEVPAWLRREVAAHLRK